MKRFLHKLLKHLRHGAASPPVARPREPLVFDRVRVIGHRRCGTHYVAALVDTNFFDGSDHLRHYAKHRWPHEVDLDDKHTVYVFVWRHFDAVAKSIFQMRARFGLAVDDFEAFLQTPYAEMWRPTAESGDGTTFSTLKAVNVTTVPGSGLRRIQMRPKELWTAYNTAWLEHSARPNVIVIPYECFVDNFEFSMLYLARRLGSHKAEFTNLTNKIGWSRPTTAK